MLQATLTRDPSSDQGTEGVFLCPELHIKTFTLELPWLNNTPNISCIPTGKYICTQVDSPRFGKVYQVMDVEGRTHILNHSGNFAGDKSKGYLSHVLGCIIHGEKRGTIKGQIAVLKSRETVRKMNATLAGQEFTLTIKNKEKE